MVNSGLPQSTIANLRKVTQSQMDAASKIQDQGKAAAALIRAEQQATNSLKALRRKFTLKRPTGIALTKELSRQWEAYGNQKDQLERELFAPFDEEISRTLGQVANQARVYIDQRKRLEERIKALAESRKKELAEISREANATANDTRTTVFGITEKARAALEQAIKNIEVDLHSTDFAALDPDKIEAIRRKWEEQLVEIESRHRDALIAARDMLASLAENLQSSGDEPAQVMEALEQRMLALEEQTDDDFEMVQLGLAVAIINHEFAASIKRVRASVRELGQISKRESALRPLYESIRTNFDHLDGHLNLFTPLQRRLHRSAQTISGKSIRNYVNELFANRFMRHNVSLECTESFLNATVDCYPSTLYPAIINLVDNAVFWLSNRTTRKAILLDASAGGITVANNGSAIDERDYHRIFERGFSRKPGGRGLGLFISSRALRAESMDLAVVDPPPGLQCSLFHFDAYVEVERMSALTGFSRQAAGEFLQSVVFVDDEIYAKQAGTPVEVTTSLPRLKSPFPASAGEAPQTAQPSGVKNVAEVAAPEDHPAYHPKQLVESFARKGMVCALYEPGSGFASGKDSELFKLCDRTDIVILDWDLFNQDGRNITPLLKNLADAGQSSVPHHVRLCVVYTTKPDLVRVANQIFQALDGQTTNEVNVEDETTIIKGATRIVVLGKPNIVGRSAVSRAREVSELELADRVIDEFAKMNSGMLASYALHGIAAIRRSTKRIVDKFSADMDGPFILNRALTLASEDTFDQLPELIAEEILAVVQDSQISQSEMNALAADGASKIALDPKTFDWPVKEGRQKPQAPQLAQRYLAGGTSSIK